MTSSSRLAAAAAPRLVLLLSAALCATVPATAAELTVAPRIGLSLLDIDPGFDGVDSDSDPGAAFGLTVGYGITDAWSAELEYVRGGAETTFSGPGGSLTDDIDVSSIAAYAAYRSAGELYFSARIGARRSDVSADEGAVEDDSETGASFGAGLGYRLGERLSVEADYTLIGSDVSRLMVSGRYALGL